MSVTSTASKSATKSSQKARKTQSKSVNVSPEERRQMIEESAYFRAQQRQFQGGDPVADWLTSEQEVDELLSQSTH